MKVQFWNEWAQVSPYSPYNLRHLRQPVPSDLPAGVEAKSFGFEDAFEDLLAVNAGRPMMDLSRQACMKKDLLDHFGFNEPPIYWTRRLARDGLLPRPLPPFRRDGFGPGCMDRDPVFSRNSEQPTWSWIQASAEQLKDPNLFEASLAEFDKLSAGFSVPPPFDAPLVDQWRVFRKEVADDPVAFTAKQLRHVEEATKKLTEDAQKRTETSLSDPKWQQAMTEDLKKLSLAWQAQREKQQEQQQQQQQQQPSSENDLFDLVWSTVAQADKTFNTFAKSIVESSRNLLNETALSASVPVPKDQRKTTKRTEETDESGNKTIRSESQWVDPAGYLHSDVEVVRMDADGRVVGQENRSHVTLATQSQTTSGDSSFDGSFDGSFDASVSTSTSVSQSEQHNSSSTDDGKSTGWFWR